MGEFNVTQKLEQLYGSEKEGGVMKKIVDEPKIQKEEVKKPSQSATNKNKK